MRYFSEHEFRNANAFIGHSTIDHRATDAVVSIWRRAKDERNVLESIGSSSLWDYCFLTLVDDFPECSVIIDHGCRAGQTLGLDSHEAKNLAELSEPLALPIHTLGLKCKNSRMPIFGLDVNAVAETGPERLSGMAFFPLSPGEDQRIFLHHDPAIVLGVLGYQ